MILKILGGTPVFRSTRVPFKALLDYLEGRETLDEFLEQFPTFNREMAIAALESAKDKLLCQYWMKILLDECVPKDLRKSFIGHDCQTVPKAGLAGKRNGELPTLAEQAGFELLLTGDQGLQHHQNMANRSIATADCSCKI